MSLWFGILNKKYSELKNIAEEVWIVVAWLISGACAAGFAVIWFAAVHKELYEKRRNLEGLRDQLLMHKKASAQTRDGPDKETAAKMLETNRMIYREAAKGYNRLLKKPFNRFPAFLMRFHPADESGGSNITKQK